MKYPITIRQAQRLFSRNMSVECAEEIIDALNLKCAVWNKKIIQPALDRLAAQHGPNHILLASPEAPSSSDEGEDRSKDTDEVRPQSDNPSEDSPFHGGDGASGEVESASSSQGGESMQDASPPYSGGGKSSQDARQEGTPLPQDYPFQLDDADQKSGQAAGETGQATSLELDNSQLEGKNGLRPDGNPDTDSSPGMSALPGSRTESDPQGKTVTASASGDSDTLTDALTGRANASPQHDSQSNLQGEMDEGLQVQERGTAYPKESGDETETSSEKGHYRYRTVKGGGSGRVSTQAKKSHGGITATMSRLGITPSLVNKARKALARLTEGGESQSGPRWDWKEFSQRLQSHRPLAPARKEEEGRPAVLVLADVSGSCAGFSDESLLVAQAIGKIGLPGADIIVVSHSNGYPQQWQVNGDKISKIGLEWGEKALPWYETNLRRFNIQGVVALGDWDAEWLYHWLAEMPTITKLVWLDNWSSSVMPPTVRKDLFKSASKNQDVHWGMPWHFSEPWNRQAKSKTTYVVGCSDAGDFLKGLELGLRR